MTIVHRSCCGGEPCARGKLDVIGEQHGKNVPRDIYFMTLS
ncbi:MAG TPA: hypothetical protein VHQ92_04340 [Pseudolabrys sp.]|jgi:hypothetical protein|nr:hypothetical protein [Pseudolabrys sp.]